MTPRGIGPPRCVRTEPQRGLRREEDVGTVGHRSEQPPDDPLALAAGVHIRRVDEVAAGLDVSPQLLGRVVLVGVLTHDIVPSARLLTTSPLCPRWRNSMSREI